MEEIVKLVQEGWVVHISPLDGGGVFFIFGKNSVQKARMMVSEDLLRDSKALGSFMKNNAKSIRELEKAK